MKVSILVAGAGLALAMPVLAHDEHGDSDLAATQVGAEYMVMETSANEAAKTPFLRGLALLHNFEYDRANEQFKLAQKADPGFAMAYWGEAMTHNHSLWESQDREAALAALAKLGSTPEHRLAKARTAREAQWIDAIDTLYGEGTKEERDAAYREKMRALFEADPSDIDARAFYGLAILGASHGGRQIPVFMRAAGILEPGFMTHEHHPGILHYLIHSYDDADHAPLGARAAARYAKVAPDAGHAQHMVSHIFHALGDWKSSEEANINADAVVDRQRAAAGRDPSFCGHYNEWLAYALIQQGKDAGELLRGCRVQVEAQIASGAEGKLGSGAVASYSGMALWNGVATGNWPEPLEGLDQGFLLARFDMAYGRMLASAGNPQATAKAVSEMKALKDGIDAAILEESPYDTWIRPWIARQVAQGEAMMVLAEGREEDGLALLRAAAEAESATPMVYGPPPIGKPSWELLGEHYLKAGKFAEAATAFERALAFAPGRRLSLAGLEKSRGQAR